MAAVPPDALDVVDHVVEMRQADAAVLARLLGGHAKANEQLSNASYVVWNVSGSKAVQAAELRLPKMRGSPRVIVMDFETRQGCANRAQVVGKYGEPSELSVPTPRQPAGSPTYYVYRRKWGRLSVGIDSQDCVSSVVVDVEP